MKLTPFIPETGIFVNFEAKNKLNFFSKSVKEIVSIHPEFDEEELLDLFLKREETLTTGIGKGVAIPHVVYGMCKQHEIFVFKLKKPLDFNSLDGKPVSIVFMLVGNAAKSNLIHLQILAKLARLMKRDDFINGLMKAETKEEILEIIKKYE